MTREDIKKDYLVRDVNTNRTFRAEYSSESAEYYEVGTGKAYSPDEIEFVNEPRSTRRNV